MKQAQNNNQSVHDLLATQTEKEVIKNAKKNV